MGGRGDRAMRATLAGLVGPGAVTGGDQTTLVRVLPETTEQTAAVLAACSREGWRVWPAGRGSRRGPGPGPGPAVVLSTERLVGLTIYEPEDLTVGCRAGMRHGDLAAATAAHRQMLPLEPAAGTGATLGGTLALADAGPLRAGYGAPRDLALGVTVVTGDGRVLRFGGRVVKNVAGYDVVRLLVGSRGTLGVITELHVRLRGRPEHDVTLLLDAPDAATAAALALAVRDAAGPVALEVLADPPHPDRWQLAVRLHGSRAVVDDGRERIAGLGAAVRALEPADAAGWWRGLARRETAPPGQLRLVGAPDRIGALLSAAMRLPDLDFCCAHATEGIVRARLRAPDRSGLPARAAALSALAADVASIGGTWTYRRGLDAPEASRAGVEALEPPPRPAALERLQRQLQARFDPAGVLPGWEA